MAIQAWMKNEGLMVYWLEGSAEKRAVFYSERKAKKFIFGIRKAGCPAYLLKVVFEDGVWALAQ
jgi:hypothetical protein